MTVNVTRHITSPNILSLLDYWHQIRGSRQAPDAVDVDPVNIPRGALAHVMLADLEPEPFRIRYRLVGSHQSDLFGDYRGRYLDELGLPDGVDLLLMSDYRKAAESLEPVVGSYPWPKKYGRSATVDYVITPLLRDGVPVRFLCAEHVIDTSSQEKLDRDDLVHPLRPKAS